MSNVTSPDRFEAILNSARELFATHGYENVGMREITRHAGYQPVQAYRLGLSKLDLLAEISIELCKLQIQTLSTAIKPKANETVHEFVVRYLHALYKSDIENILIRSATAAYGWMWTEKYETRIIEQVTLLLAPISKLLTERDDKHVPARVMAIWSLYYVGFRSAVVHGASAEECINAISASLRLLTQDEH
jgi:AcrR family transcriptional regulator